MAVYAYPPEIEDYVRQMSPLLRDRELAVAVNEKFGTAFDAGKMKAYRGNHGIRNYQKQLSSEEYWKYQTKWPEGMFEFIRDNSWGVSSAEMAEMVNEKFGASFTPQRMKSFRAKYKIRSGCTGWFRRGRSPGNKGRKQSEYCSPEACEASRRTQFKKGQKPPNELPVGTIVVNTDGYKLRKKQMEGAQWERWELLHKAVWREHHGEPPAGMCVIFKDNNRLNCDISNLMLVSRGEMVTLAKKGYRFDDPELTEAAVSVVRLMQAARKSRKNRGNAT